MKIIDQYLKHIKKEIKASKIKLETEEVGIVSEIRDGVIILTGLRHVGYGEIIEFESNARGYVIDITEDEVAAIVLGDYLKIRSGEQAKATKLNLSVPVTDEILGRIIDPLSISLDGLGSIKSKKIYPLEKVAPSVVYRAQVNVPLQTGIKAIDALIPIGRGQRELILGDRGTGKSTLAIDTILNQKNENVICIYCAIGQKNSKVAAVIDLLRNNKALDYTVVVNASASDAVSLQYLAPYTACTIGEYFMDKGRDVLVVYDDLTKHAWAYRQISLILRRQAGREAYPGDIFYLHSRLLERACRLDKKYGGGSLTALPIIETLEGDLSTYIPTNVISITDGQIVLESDLFNAGIRPAINIGLSVSRVGGNAQTKIIKKIAGKLKLDLAQYREMTAFSQFEAELDEETRKFLNRGSKLTQILIQKKNSPYELGFEAAILWAATQGYLDELPINKIEKFESLFINDLKINGKKIINLINKSKILTEEIENYFKQSIESNLKRL